jgi:glycosyltransferase involved in cell wall biosynthesis
MSMLTVGLVCDLLEEQWPSMDLVAHHLGERLKEGNHGVKATMLRPSLRRRVTRWPLGARLSRASVIDRLLNRHLDYPRWLSRHSRDYDVYHIVDHSYAQLVQALPAARTVVTCHDLDAFRCLMSPSQERRSVPFRALARRTLQGLAAAARVVCDSDAVRRELSTLPGMHADRLRVVPLGVDPVFSAGADPVGDAHATELLGPVDPAVPELLHVGSTVARKRLDVVLRAFAIVRGTHPGARLVRVGGRLTRTQQTMAIDLGVAGAIRELTDLDTRTLAAVYRRARAVIVPSDREGFGLPVLEALACGTPVVASDLAPMRETGGGAALFCAPGDADAFAAEIIRVFTNPDPDRRTRGLRHAAALTWPAYVARMVDIYREVCSGNVPAPRRRQRDAANLRS